jgi:hypothetical protein
MKDPVYLHVRNPKDDELGTAPATQIFSALLPTHLSLFRRTVQRPKNFAFEIYLLNNTIHFYITTPREHQTLVTSLLSSSYPRSVASETTDPMLIIAKQKHVDVGELMLSAPYYLPIKTFKEFSEVDALSAVIGFLAKKASAKVGVGEAA